MKGMKKIGSKALASVLASALFVSGLAHMPAAEVQAAFGGKLTSAVSASADENIVMVTFNDDVQAKITFLEDGIFRYNVDPNGEFSEYGRENNGEATAKIVQYPDDYDAYSLPYADVEEEGDYIVITSGETVIKFEKATAKMTVEFAGKVVMEESDSLSLGGTTTQSLVKHEGENFYGGGTQNGRFVHTGETINIANESNWVDGGVASPSPFYYTTEGYGVLRNTFMPGKYHFGSQTEGVVSTVHNENEFDAYYFLSDGENSAQVVQELLQGYYHVTGDPTLLPEYAFYMGHLNAYNRDSWTDTAETGESGGWLIKGSSSANGEDDVPIASKYKEHGMAAGYVLKDGMMAESLNGEAEVITAPGSKYPNITTPHKFSARGVIDQYIEYDMPLGYFLPNDGYGTGYGKNGYYMTGGVNADGSSTRERIAAIDANVENLREFTKYAQSKGVETGLWTQSNLSPDSYAGTSWHLLRDFEKEVKIGGITTLKTDVAWVGYGYNFAYNGIKNAYDIVTTGVNYRPNIISLDGWAGTQRFAGIWTGDQYGGNWEYIRFHVPTFIGQSLAGNPNVGSDMDGIFGGEKIIATRDTQWKSFGTVMLDMDGWGSYAKTPQTFGDPYTGIARMYLKTKAQLMPYIYTTAAASSNLETGNDDAGLPIVRAMFLEFPDDAYANTKAMQYQYMLGESLLVAPVYTETAAIDSVGNDVRNGIYLPDEEQVWIDYFTGKQYNGGQVLNNFDAPIWKLPVFVKNGAIIPMWEENNSPALVDRANRLVEFWPEGNTEYTLYEDDGTTVENEQTQIAGYGTVNEISYGEHVSTKYTSKVNGTTAVLTAEKSTGNYEGYDRNKNTTFIVNVSKEPSAVTAKNGSKELTKVAVDSKEALLDAEVAAGTFAYYYDAAPAIETYGVEIEDEFAAMMKDEVSSPKLYVKFAETDSQANAQVLTIEGFENVDKDLPVNELDESLAVPANLKDVVESKTPTSNTISWDAVEGAESYEVRINGVVNNVGDATSYVHADQPYNSTHTYAVRARGANGYSAWSDEIEATTALDPWRNVPKASISWNGGEQWGALANATDHDTASMFHSTGDVVSNAEPFIFDFGSVYKLDHFEYYPRDAYSNGTVKQMDIYVSLDGVHWSQAHNGAENRWTYSNALSYEENVKTVDLSGQMARYVKLVVKESVGNFFSANELAIYKVDGSTPFAVGSTTQQPVVSDGDYTNMINYMGTSPKDESDFIDQIKQRGGDINKNEVYDVYDYTFTMFNLDGGTKKTGRISGNAGYDVSADTVNAGETITIDVVAANVANLNAFGQVLAYDPAVVDFVSVEAGSMIGEMEDMNRNKVYGDGSAYLNLAYANRGDKALVKGSGVLATITMKAKADVTVADVIDLSKLTIIGPDHSFIEIETGSEAPTPGPTPVVTKYGQNDVTITMTNEYLPTDDGSNVTKLIQQGNYDGLFNGVQGRDFEFLWDWEGNWDAEGKLPAHVTLPVTMHVTFNEPSKLTQVTVYNANKGNGFATKAEAVLNYSDGTTSETLTLTAAESYDAFDFVWEDNGKTVVSADVTILEAINYSNESVTNMLTLDEIELKHTEIPKVPVEDIVYGQSDVTLTMTNAELTTDNGSNVTVFIQQGNYNGLFDGNKTRDFEFIWDIESNWDADGKLPSYVTLPVTMNIALNEAALFNQVTVYNANKANGYITKAEAVINYADGTTGDKLVIELGENEKVDYAAFDFVWEASDKAVASVDVTFLTAEKKDGTPVTNMLTLAEMELKYSETAEPTPLPETPDVPEIPEDEVCKVYADVEHGAWYEEAVQYVSDAGIMTGNDGLFSPDNDVTRAVMVETLYKMEGKPAVTDFTAYSEMTDVAADGWYKNSVAWGMNNNIVTGDTYFMTFSPEANVTREQLATFLYRYANFKGIDTTLSATADEILGGTWVADWAKEAFAWAVDSGIIKGVETADDAGNYYFDLNPQGTATRAQLATMLQRFLESAAE